MGEGDRLFAQLPHDQLQEQQRGFGGLFVFGEVTLDALLLLAAERRVGDPRRNTQSFRYDDLYRLTRVGYSFDPTSPSSPVPDPSANFIDYRYDRIGNMLAQTSDLEHVERGLPVTNLGELDYGGTLGRMNRTGRSSSDPPGPHALTRISDLTSQIPDRDYPYDANGNMTRIDGLRCTWDFLDRLVAVEDDAMRAECRYDMTGRRVIKRVTPKTGPPAPGGPPDGATANARPSVSLYPGRHFEVREHDQPTKYVFNGGTRVARITGSLSPNSRVQRIRLYPGWNLTTLNFTAGFGENSFEGGSANVIRATEAAGLIRVDRDAPEYGAGSRTAFVVNLAVPGPKLLGGGGKAASTGSGATGRAATSTLGTGAGSIDGASGRSVGAANVSGGGIIRGGSARTAGGEVAGGGGVFARTGENAALANTAMSGGTQVANANYAAAQAWYMGMVNATRDARYMLPTSEQRREAFSLILTMRDILFFPLGK